MSTVSAQDSLLDQSREFHGRHIGVAPDELPEMLAELGVDRLSQLINQIVPPEIRQPTTVRRPGHSEAATIARLRQMAAKNRVFKSYIGMGYYGSHTPAVIQRDVLQNPAWYTAYTPYQPEISQGRLEALLNYQTMVSDLTGLEVANASMLDEATAAAEAMAMCRRISKNTSPNFFVSHEVHPQTLAVLQTRAKPLGVTLVVGDHRHELEGLECFGALFQYPGTSGEIHDFSSAIAYVQQQRGLAVMAADLLSLTLLKSPGETGADIAVGSTQRFGVPLFFGGPHAGYLATSTVHQRAIPGRLIGVSIDSHDRPAYRMTLQTREQHIRRAKATSNICTAQALLAMTAGFYAIYHGPEGLTQIAQRIFYLTSVLQKGLNQLGYRVDNQRWFDTLTVETPAGADSIHAAATEREMNFRRIDSQRIGISLDETTTAADLENILACFAIEQPSPSFADLEPVVISQLDPALARNSEFLTHPVFHQYRTETEMMRYLRQLADKDLALDRTMIPLGSCTMKLNSATEMMATAWDEFANIHPFVPDDQSTGYAELIADLQSMLCEASGYDAVSLQPNAGSQGEFAGLLAIQAYHHSRGEGHRNVCLIPDSAHGTNPASATMAGMNVVVVNCDEEGNVDIADLQRKAELHHDNLAAMMITYPSTHGVFEEHVTDLCEIIHDHGGQVYIDGANLNAQVGLCQPGKYGGDVSHLNLHKTFCIPHGGGGPGVGPVAVREHLARFLPSNPIESTTADGVGPVAATAWGSAGILPISWAYIYMMGDEGLQRASEYAILNANYVASRLAPHFPILYTGSHNRVAHECILDVRPMAVTVDDIAKRLVDYGFHAPTMSFPVAGTLMIEPTESESKAELDRFCEAMIQIRAEIREIEEGRWLADDNPLTNAPHTIADLAADQWNHPYSRETAAFPVPTLRNGKYWAPVSRINQAFGDRNVMCTCPSPREFELQSIES